MVLKFLVILGYQIFLIFLYEYQPFLSMLVISYVPFSKLQANPDYKGVCHIALTQERHCRPGEVHELIVAI